MWEQQQYQTIQYLVASKKYQDMKQYKLIKIKTLFQERNQPIMLTYKIEDT